MKKIKQSISTVLPTAKIFLDDLEEIDKILRESCSSYNINFNEYELKSINEVKEVHKIIEETRKILEESYSFYTITLDEYKLDSINEIKEIEEKQHFHNLEITLTKPYFNLKMDEFSTHIYSEEDSLCIGIIERIKPIIKKRRKTYFQCWFDIFIFLVNVLLLFINLLDSYINLYSDFIGYIILATILPLDIIFIRSVFKDDKSKFIVFTTKKSNEQSNYFIENKDELITKLFFGIITTAIGIFIGNKVIPWFTSLLTGQ